MGIRHSQSITSWSIWKSRRWARVSPRFRVVWSWESFAHRMGLHHSKGIESNSLWSNRRRRHCAKEWFFFPRHSQYVMVIFFFGACAISDASTLYWPTKRISKSNLAYLQLLHWDRNHIHYFSYLRQSKGSDRASFTSAFRLCLPSPRYITAIQTSCPGYHSRCATRWASASMETSK